MNIIKRNPVELAWAAGFLDGEGHFGLRGADGSPFVEAAQVRTRAPLDRLQVLFGGSIRCGRSAWRWKLEGRPAVQLALPLLYPYLCVKQEEAHAVLVGSCWVAPREGPALDPELRPLVRAAKDQTRARLLALRRVA